MPNLSSIESIRDYGFKGFKTIASLRLGGIEEVPRKKGVYAVLAPESFQYIFSKKSKGGFFKGRDPSVPIENLQSKWVSGALVLYLGKAGSPGGKATLYKRIRSYIRFGCGDAIGHWGGRYIWQLGNVEKLLICWLALPDGDPRELEKRLIFSFETKYGVLPFANLRR